MKKNEKINGESGDVRGKTVNSWKERTPELPVTTTGFRYYP